MQQQIYIQIAILNDLLINMDIIHQHNTTQLNITQLFKGSLKGKAKLPNKTERYLFFWLHPFEFDWL